MIYPVFTAAYIVVIGNAIREELTELLSGDYQ